MSESTATIEASNREMNALRQAITDAEHLLSTTGPFTADWRASIDAALKVLRSALTQR